MTGEQISMPSSPKNSEDHSVDEPIPKTKIGNNDRSLYSMLAKHYGNHLLHPIFLVHNINSWYKLGTAELFLGGKTTKMKGLPIVFDSGSTYTYFSGESYKALYSMLMNDMKGKKVYITNEDKSLPVCWKGSKPFKSIYDVKNLFEPIILKFKKSKLQLNPESYLVISTYHFKTKSSFKTMRNSRSDGLLQTTTGSQSPDSFSYNNFFIKENNNNRGK
uniref:Xylanase inhibitor C-terminal domain-containing protein n=1 Tax=Lactuca sativa TaxID=4236 RepID=A0A9R1XVQ4_LACSA|nr:hypothetical protein LSAT_V11C100049680 [Lactuca sativa]